MRSESMWINETLNIAGGRVHERLTNLEYTVVAVCETGMRRLITRAEFSGTRRYFERQRQVVVYLRPSGCPTPAGWEAIAE
jgi:hypothetical protein